MTTVPCPGCSAPLTVEQEVCERCRRPRDEGEIERGRQALADAYSNRRGLPWRLLRWTAAASLAAVAFHSRAPLRARLGQARAAFSAEMERVRSGGRPAAAAAAPSLASPAADTPSSPPPPLLAAPATPPERPQADVRRVYGVVYDLETLKPVSRARLRFYQRGGETVMDAYTDAEGHYASSLHENYFEKDVILSVTAPGYRDGQLEDTQSPYRERTLEQRLRVLAGTSDHELGDVVVPRSGTQLIQMDLVLLARKPPEGAPLAEPPPPPGEPPNNMRRFYGVVYDLATLRPVAGAHVRLMHKGGAAITTTNTNPAGHYSADVYLEDVERGVVVSVSAAGYREGQLEESGAPYRERPLDSRKKTAEETADADLSALLLPSGDSRAVPLDLVLLPSKP